MNNKHESLLTLYKQVLASVDLVTDDHGAITFAPQGIDEPVPAAIEGKRWVLPTAELLNTRGALDEVITFHPLSENFLNGESVVLARFKAAINLKLGAVTSELMAWLVKYAASPEKQQTGNVGVKASRFLKLVPNIKEISAERIEEIIERSASANDRRFVNLYLKKGGDILDSRYQWACIATFPFRQELDGETPKVFGVTISKKDQQSFKALFDYILPDNELPETYSAGSKVRSACKFDATLRSFAKIATRLNEVISTHRKLLPTYKDLMIKLDWVDNLGDMDKLADIVPPLPGNEGEGTRDRRSEGGVTAKQTVQSGITAKAKRAFGQIQPGKTQSTIRPSVEEQEEDEPAGTLDQVSGGRSQHPQQESFHDRMERQRRQSNSGGYRAGGGGYSSPAIGRGNYANTAQDAVPDWAHNQGKSMMVAGQDPNEGRQDRFANRQNQGSGFLERISRGGRSQAYGGGQQGGGFRGGQGGGNYRL